MCQLPTTTVAAAAAAALATTATTLPQTDAGMKNGGGNWYITIYCGQEGGMFRKSHDTDSCCLMKHKK